MSTSETVQELMDRWEDCCAQGRVMTAEELCRDHPHLLDEVRRQIRGLQAMYCLVVSGPGTYSQSHNAPTYTSRMAA
jgi:hypothetical protein